MKQLLGAARDLGKILHKRRGHVHVDIKLSGSKKKGKKRG